MTRTDVGLVTAALQGIAIMVGITVFYGRLYLLGHYKALGIPVSEIKLSAIDYAIASPTITVMGVVACVLVGAYP